MGFQHFHPDILNTFFDCSTGDEKVELSAQHRLYQYKFQVMVARTDQATDLPTIAAKQVVMMAALATMSDTNLDPLLPHLNDVPLHLDA